MRVDTTSNADEVDVAYRACTEVTANDVDYAMCKTNCPYWCAVGELVNGIRSASQ